MSSNFNGLKEHNIMPQTAEEKLKEVIDVYEQGAGIKAMLSDIAEFLDSRAMEGQSKYDAQQEKDEYLAELIESDSSIAEALHMALDELSY